MELLQLLNPLAKSNMASHPGDTRLYQIVTRHNSYCGRIAHQNSVMIKLQSKAGKPVKILKENIKSIGV